MATATDFKRTSKDPSISNHRNPTPMKLTSLLFTAPLLTASAADLPPVFVVPNFHPASCGWLANWSAERNYCANSYLAHLDRVRDDPSYRFALSECNNLIAIRNFAPERFEELKQRVREGRVELVNGFFLEPTVSLSGGEALAKMGIEGLRWQRQVMGKTPRFCWAIDICGAHEQLPQLNAQLGLEALVYARSNPSSQSDFSLTIARWHPHPDACDRPIFRLEQGRHLHGVRRKGSTHQRSTRRLAELFFQQSGQHPARRAGAGARRQGRLLAAAGPQGTTRRSCSANGKPSRRTCLCGFRPSAITSIN